MKVKIIECASKIVLVDREMIMSTVPNAGEIIQFAVDEHVVKRFVVFSRYESKEDRLELWVGR